MEDHPLRYQLANELHARPFPVLSAPAGAVYLAIKRTENAVARDRDEDRAHLIDLLDRFGADHPKPGSTHWFGDIGKYKLKWEQHTEFVTYTLFLDHLEERAYAAQSFEHFPSEWLDKVPGTRITSALIRVVPTEVEAEIVDSLKDWFVAESLAVSTVLGGSAVIAGDFRIDAAGHMRFAIFTSASCGARRIGRIVQRLCEIETYKSMSMLGLSRARNMGAQMGVLDTQLSGLMSSMTERGAKAEQTLEALLETSAQLENMAAQSAFRFAATRAYEAIVHQRIEVLREDRFLGRQSFAEFMMRRFDPAMRTAASTQSRLQTMAERATRAGNLLRTRVDVERSAQSQNLLESMNRRADLQLKLQKTVEGFSVVAISYYAVNLALYFVAPFGKALGMSKVGLAALITPIIIGLVWFMVRRIHHSFSENETEPK
jgi:uncharacterized membrane-anchored protein